MWRWCDIKVWGSEEGLFERIFELDLKNMVEFQHLEIWGLRGQQRLKVRHACINVGEEVSEPQMSSLGVGFT